MQVDEPLAVGPTSAYEAATDADINTATQRQGQWVCVCVPWLPGLAVTILGVAVGIAVDTRRHP